MPTTGGPTWPRLAGLFYVKGRTRTSRRSFDGNPGQITYLSGTRSCTRKVTKAYPNTLTADRKATWKCRARKASDVDGPTWLRRTLPAAILPSRPKSWFLDYTAEPGFAVAGHTPTLGIYLSESRIWLAYTMTPTSMEFENYFRGVEETDQSIFTLTIDDVPKLPPIAALTLT